MTIPALIRFWASAWSRRTTPAHQLVPPAGLTAQRPPTATHLPTFGGTMAPMPASLASCCIQISGGSSAFSVTSPMPAFSLIFTSMFSASSPMLENSTLVTYRHTV